MYEVTQGKATRLGMGGMSTNDASFLPKVAAL
jgi:hypothetical protein